MSTEEGVISRTVKSRAWVVVRRSAMCDGCKSKSACNSPGGSKNMESEALNTIGAARGDRVLLELSSKSIWKISFIFYMIPVIALIAGALAGMDFGTKNSVDPEVSALVAAILFSGVSFLILKLISLFFIEKEEYIPRVVKILTTHTSD